MRIRWGIIALALCSTMAARSRPALARDPLYVRQCDNHGNRYSLDEQIKGCTATIRSGRFRGKNLAWAFDSRGVAYKKKRQYDRAIKDYDKALRLDPKAAYAYDNRGNAYRRKGQYDRAIVDFDKAIRLDPKDPDAFNNRGLAYEDKGQYDRAIQDYDKAIRLNAKDPFFFYNRGNSYRYKGQYDRAIQDYDKAIRLDPNDAESFNNRGGAYRHEGQYDRAIEDYDKAIRLDPKFVYAFHNRGMTYDDKGQHDRAIKDYDEVIRLDPKNAAAFASRGRANFYAGTLPKALADLDQASELSPKDAYTALWLDIVSSRSKVTGRLDRAISQIDMTKWPAPVIRLYLGQMTPAAVLAAADDPDSKTKRGQVCEANFYTGELTLDKGARDEATRLLRLAVADCPKDYFEYTGAVAELKRLGR